MSKMGIVTAEVQWTRTWFETYLTVGDAPFTETPGHGGLPIAPETVRLSYAYRGSERPLCETVVVTGRRRTFDGSISDVWAESLWSERGNEPMPAWLNHLVDEHRPA